MAYHKCASIYGTNNSAASIQTASGAIANFNTKLAMPLKSLEIDVNATQEAGTPTPQSPKAISGVSEIKLGYADFNQLINVVTQERQGLTASIDNDGIISVSGTSTTSYSNITSGIIPEIDHIYLIKKTVISNPNSISFNWGMLNAVFNPNVLGTNDTQEFITKVTMQSGFSTGIRGFSANTDFTGVKFKTICIDLTKALGSDKANYIYSLTNYGIDLAKQLFTKDYYPYNAGGTIVTLDSVNGEPTCQNAVINLGGTYYGGYVSQDKNGKRELVVTYSALISLNSLNYKKVVIGGNNCFYADLPNGFIAPITYFDGLCSTYPSTTQGTLPNDKTCKFYSDQSWNFSRIAIRDDSASDMSATEFKAYVTGYICYQIKTPFTVELPDGEPIITLNGTNNIYADTGDTKVSYKKLI